jgi:hypothetical protein
VKIPDERNQETSVNPATMKKPVFLILTCSLACSVLFLKAQEDWKLKLDKEGIRIYTRPYTDSKIRALKVVCTLEARLSQMTAVLLDIKSQDEWFYHTKSILLLQVSPSELYYYAELSFPMPFSNRDFIEHIKVSQNAITRIVTMDVQNVPSYILPKSGIIRIVQSDCKWVVTPAGKNLVTVEFILFANPAGSVPAWLINMFSLYGPFDTFKKLKLQLKKAEYQNVSLPFITD